MTQTVFTLLIWAFVETGITTSHNSSVTPRAEIFSRCFTGSSIAERGRSLGTPCYAVITLRQKIDESFIKTWNVPKSQSSISPLRGLIARELLQFCPLR